MSKTNKRSVVLVAAGIFLLLGLGTISRAQAETAKVTRNTRVLQRPAERSIVVTRVGRGKVVRVLERDGKWVKVRVNGRTGWVARKSLTANVNARGSINSERRRPFVTGRSKKRNFGGSGPKDLVGADAVDPDTLEEAPDEDESAGDAEPDEDTQEAAPPDEEVLEDEDRGQKRKRVAAREKSAKKSRDRSGNQEEDMAVDGEDSAEQDEVVRVAAATALRIEPSASSKPVVDAGAGAKLIVLEKTKGWLFVENTNGDQGWIRADDVAAGGSLGSYQYPRLLIRTSARASMAMIRNKYAYIGQGVQIASLANDTLSLLTGGELLFKLKPAIMVRGDLSYTGVLGKVIDGTQSPPTSMSYSTHELNLGAGAGYNFQDARGMVVYGRAGFHYTYLQVAPVNNTLKLPSEVLLGATLGSSVDIPRLFDKIGIRASADVLLPFAASRSQTGQLEDGQQVTLTWALWLTALASYQLQPTLHVEASYRLYRGRTNWDGASQRVPDLTSTARLDINHLLGVGVSKLF